MKTLFIFALAILASQAGLIRNRYSIKRANRKANRAYKIPSPSPQKHMRKCGEYYEEHEGVCVKMCTHPEFVDCPDIFIKRFYPSFCGLTADYHWRNFTFEC